MKVLGFFLPVDCLCVGGQLQIGQILKGRILLSLNNSCDAKARSYEFPRENVSALLLVETYVQ